jgi:TonB-dependent SusC/RagA subfamily outer membrane receptor
LEEVVVVGYGVQRKSSVTGAISQVKAEDMQNRTITRPEQALQGKTAGVQIVQTSGAPGAAPQVRVRGYSSNSSSSPLFVVDGIRLTSIGGLDPNDIASMEVLKDAASAAIYGAEAGNGVILITTKKGQAGFSKISYDFQYSSQSLARIPKMLNSEQYIDYMTEGQVFTLLSLMEGWDGVTNTS